MHIYFSGIGGAGIGPLALIAHQAGFQVSGSDKQSSTYFDYLKKEGITNIHVGQSYTQIADVHAQTPIDWFVYTSALPIEQPNAPELQFCREQSIKATKRDEFLNFLLHEKGLALIAIAGTHGKTTTTAMVIWAMKCLELPISYSVGAKLSFGEMGEFNPASKYFIYEADEFDRNFLAFQPHIAVITGVDWDHPDIYPTRASYHEAFRQFLLQSQSALLWQADAKQLKLSAREQLIVLDDKDPAIDQQLTLPGHVNRLNAWQVVCLLQQLTKRPFNELLAHLNAFPGISRRFEQIAPGLYSDYAHTPPKIRGALQLAHEVAPGRVVVIYEGLHNTRQHFIKDDLLHLFDEVKQLYIVPSYLARENPNLALLQPDGLRQLLSQKAQAHTQPMTMNAALAKAIKEHLAAGDLVLALSAGGGHSLDEWLRHKFVDSGTPQHAD